MKRFWQILISAVVIISLSGCSDFFDSFHTEKSPSRQQLCRQLHSQIIFNDNVTGTSSATPNMVNATPTLRARNMREYRRYNCDQVIQ